MGQPDFIAQIRERLNFHNERFNFHKTQIEVWQAALESALGKPESALRKQDDAGSLLGAPQKKLSRPESPIAYVLSVIERTGGVTPAEILTQAKSEFAGPFGRNFPYKQLGQLKATERIEKQMDKYVLRST